MESREYYTDMVELYLQNYKKNEYKYFGEEDGTESWVFSEGSVLTNIYLLFEKDPPSLRIFTPLVFIPQKNILTLYRACLEANFELINCALCVNRDTVGLVAERSLDGLDPQELASSINYISKVGDNLDNMLKDDFGAKIFSEEM